MTDRNNEARHVDPHPGSRFLAALVVSLIVNGLLLAWLSSHVEEQTSRAPAGRFTIVAAQLPGNTGATHQELGEQRASDAPDAAPDPPVPEAPREPLPETTPATIEKPESPDAPLVVAGTHPAGERETREEGEAPDPPPVVRPAAGETCDTIPHTPDDNFQLHPSGPAAPQALARDVPPSSPAPGERGTSETSQSRGDVALHAPDLHLVATDRDAYLEQLRLLGRQILVAFPRHAYLLRSAEPLETVAVAIEELHSTHSSRTTGMPQEAWQKDILRKVAAANGIEDARGEVAVLTPSAIERRLLGLEEQYAGHLACPLETIAVMTAVVREDPAGVHLIFVAARRHDGSEFRQAWDVLWQATPGPSGEETRLAPGNEFSGNPPGSREKSLTAPPKEVSP
ncbi:MAG: hypothetical protein AB1486_04515 [Planctomycetota bacterium]